MTQTTATLDCLADETSPTWRGRATPAPDRRETGGPTNTTVRARSVPPTATDVRDDDA
jgi:hypothetical protein